MDGRQTTRGGLDGQMTEVLGKEQMTEETGDGRKVWDGTDRLMAARQRGGWSDRETDNGRTNIITCKTHKPEVNLMDRGWTAGGPNVFQIVVEG